MGRHENPRSLWLVTPMLLFALLAVIFGSISLRADQAADRFRGQIGTADGTVLKYEGPSLVDSIFSKFAEGHLVIGFRTSEGRSVQARVRNTLDGPSRREGAVVQLQYVQMTPTTARIVGGQNDAGDDATFYGIVALVCLLLVTVLAAIEAFSRWPHRRV